MTAVIENQPDREPGSPRPLLLITGAIVSIFGLGTLAGLVAAMREAGKFAAVDVLLIMGGLAVILGGLALLSKGARGQWLPRSPAQRKAVKIMLLTMGIGCIIGAAFSSMSGAPGLEHYLASEPISKPAAWVFIGGLAVAMPLSIWWLRLIDEHERAAHDIACVAALYLYTWLAPTWWFAWRGSLAVEPNHGVIYGATMATFCIVWLYRKFR